MTKKEKLSLDNEKKFLEFAGIPFPYKRPKWRGNAKADKRKILSLADPHEPYGNEQVYCICEAKHTDAGVLVVPGDIGDYYSKSRFKKTRHVTFAEELNAVFRRIEWMATNWQQVYIMIGNHDNRPEKKIASLFGDDTELQIMTEQNLLVKLASFFDNVEIVGTQIAGSSIHMTHIWQYGDIIFTHAEKSMTQKSALMGNISQQIFKWKDTFKLRPYSVIAQAHNHASLKMTEGSETWFLLPTAAQKISVGFEYAFSTQLIGTPACTGYTIFYQENGRTDINYSNNYLI